MQKRKHYLERCKPKSKKKEFSMQRKGKHYLDHSHQYCLVPTTKSKNQFINTILIYISRLFSVTVKYN